jgi:hypothetical protein
MKTRDAALLSTWYDETRMSTMSQNNKKTSNFHAFKHYEAEQYQQTIALIKYIPKKNYRTK